MKLRVLSYNIHKGFDTFGLKFTLHELKTALQNLDLDLVLLQEVVGEHKIWKKNIKTYPNESQFEYLADSMWPYYSYGKNAIFDIRHHGNAILSKYPIVKSENINISTNRFESRGLLHCEVALPGYSEPFHVFNTHLDLLDSGRKKQTEQLAKRILEHVPQGTPFLIGGDFNDWSKKTSSRIATQLGVFEAFHILNGKYAKTFPAQLPVLSLDRVYMKSLKVTRAEVLQDAPWSFLSDHLPLLVEFEILFSENSVYEKN